MNSQEKFINDLNVGQASEIIVANYFKAQGWGITMNDSKVLKELKGWDLEIRKGNKTFKVEVKTDVSCPNTGNVAVEFNNTVSGPSGIDATISDFFIYHIKSTLFIFQSLDLYNSVHSPNPLWFKCIKCGDGARSECVLYKLNDFVTIKHKRIKL